MIKLLLTITLGLNTLFTPYNEEVQKNLGVAQNSHYVQFLNGEGYYIEEEGLINKNEVVYITDNGNIYILDSIQEWLKNHSFLFHLQKIQYKKIQNNVDF